MKRIARQRPICATCRTKLATRPFSQWRSPKLHSPRTASCSTTLKSISSPLPLGCALAARRWQSTVIGEPEQTEDPRFRPASRSGIKYAFSDTPENENLVMPLDDLFHSFSDSPIADLRRRASYMKHHAYCPHPSHRKTRATFAPHDPEARKSPGPEAIPAAHVKFECPDCGIPVTCCEEHFMDDYHTHLEFCDVLRQINEDDHDLYTGRYFEEFNYPEEWLAEALINLSNWDTLLYTRRWLAVNSPRALRQVTKLVTYPATIASVLHELSPYNIKEGGRLTMEGLKSFTGILSKRVILRTLVRVD